MTELTFAKSFLSVLDSRTTKYQPEHVFDPLTFPTRTPYVLPKLSSPPHPPPPKSLSSSAAPGSEPLNASSTDQGATSTTTTTTGTTIVLKSTRNPVLTITVLNADPRTTLVASLRQLVYDNLAGGVATVEKVKVLQNKKPVPSSKLTVADCFVSSPTSTSEKETATPEEIEFGIMIIGGAPDLDKDKQVITIDRASASTPAVTNEKTAAGPDSENAAIEAATGTNPATVEKDGAGEVGGAAAVGGREAEGGGGETEKVEGEAMEGVTQTINTGVNANETLKSTEFWDDLQGFLEQRLKDAEEAKRLRTVFEKVAST